MVNKKFTHALQLSTRQTRTKAHHDQLKNCRLKSLKSGISSGQVQKAKRPGIAQAYLFTK
jgi:hypothetical protein